MHGSHLRWQVQTRCAPVQTSSVRTLRAPPAPSRADSSVRMLQGLPINNAPATRKGRCRTGASRVCRYQDGESLIRIADRDSDRCKPITSTHDMLMRMSIDACRNAKTMRRCAPSCVSWQHQRELDPRGGPSQVQPHHMRSHTSAVPGHLRSHGDTHLHVTRSPSIHAHHAAKEHAHAHANKYACNFITRCTSVLLSYYFGIYGIIICDCYHAHARM